MAGKCLRRGTIDPENYPSLQWTDLSSARAPLQAKQMPRFDEVHDNSWKEREPPGETAGNENRGTPLREKEHVGSLRPKHGLEEVCLTE